MTDDTADTIEQKPETRRERRRRRARKAVDVAKNVASFVLTHLGAIVYAAREMRDHTRKDQP